MTTETTLLENDTDAEASVLRPDAVNYLFADYGNYLGIEGLAFDEENTIVLEIEGTVVALEYVNPVTGIVMTSEITALPETPEAEFFVSLNASNHISLTSGLGQVTMDPNDGAIIWSNHMYVDTLTVEMLDEALKRSVKCIASWRELISEFLGEDGTLTAEAATFDASAVDAPSMIKV